MMVGGTGIVIVFSRYPSVERAPLWAILAGAGSVFLVLGGFASSLYWLAILASMKTRVVEFEMAEALGLSASPDTRAATSNHNASGNGRRPSWEPPGPDVDPESTLGLALDPPPPPEYRPRVLINLENRTSSMLAEFVRQQSDGNARLVLRYYVHGLRQASTSFIFGMVLAVVGFVISAAAVADYIARPHQLAGIVAAGVVGVLVEGVGLLFLRRANKGRDLVLDLVDRLLDDRERESCFLGAITVIEQVSSLRMKDALRAAAVLKFTDSTIPPEQLAALLSSDAFLTWPGSKSSGADRVGQPA
jgi:hypothetical protein